MLNIEQLARLSRLAFTEEEKARVGKDMEGIVALMDTLKDADIPAEDDRDAGIPISALRPDTVVESFDREVLIRQSKSGVEGALVIPRIVE